MIDKESTALQLLMEHFHSTGKEQDQKTAVEYEAEIQSLHNKIEQQTAKGNSFIVIKRF